MRSGGGEKSGGFCDAKRRNGNKRAKNVQKDRKPQRLPIHNMPNSGVSTFEIKTSANMALKEL